MSKLETTSNGKATSRRSAKPMYRGIVLPKLTSPSRIPLEEIERAVADAFAARSAALAKD